MASKYKATVVLVVGSVHTGHGDLGLNLDGHLTSLGARCLASMLPSRRFLLIGLFALRMSGVFAAGELTVIIEPGHGGTNDTGTHLLKSNSSPNNATSPSGLREKDLTLELSREIQRAFESERVPITLRRSLTGAPFLATRRMNRPISSSWKNTKKRSPLSGTPP